jgi:hypothetical protein
LPCTKEEAKVEFDSIPVRETERDERGVRVCRRMSLFVCLCACVCVCVCVCVCIFVLHNQSVRGKHTRIHKSSATTA